MGIKAVLIDISKTSIQGGLIIDGIVDLVKEFLTRDIKPYFVANFKWKSKNDISTLMKDEDLSGIEILTSKEVGGVKGTRKFIDHVCSENNIKQNQIIYIGDDNADMYETANTAVIFFFASWTNST